MERSNCVFTADGMPRVRGKPSERREIRETIM